MSDVLYYYFGLYGPFNIFVYQLHLYKTLSYVSITEDITIHVGTNS
jgi:hypothetical protein